jgi:hypothetical protein
MSQLFASDRDPNPKVVVESEKIGFKYWDPYTFCKESQNKPIKEKNPFFLKQ